MASYSPFNGYDLTRDIWWKGGLMDLQRGMREKLDKYVDFQNYVDIEMNINGPGIYDFCCFGVDADDNLSDDRYMIFYNQTSSPQNEIIYEALDNGASFRVNLNSLPMSIQKLVFTVSIDGDSTMGDISGYSFILKQNQGGILELKLYGNDFEQEKAIITVEIYRKDTWRINAIARGFNGGLGNLLRNYGGEEETDSSAGNSVISGTGLKEQESVNPPLKNQSLGETSPVVQESTKQALLNQETMLQGQKPFKISLEKKLESGAPKLVSLVKPIKVQLEKHKLQDTIARVALVMDISGSMRTRYKDGTVQDIVNHILPLAVQFDDDGELDFWYYGFEPMRMESVNMQNYEEAVPETWKDLMKQLGGRNNEPEVINLVIEEYKDSRIPAYVIFVTDGGFASKGKIKKLLTEASRLPIFWQFVGVGGSAYGILEELDNMGGRYVDNANFFALDDFKSVENEDLYSRLLNEFPGWLREIKAKGMI